MTPKIKLTLFVLVAAFLSALVTLFFQLIAMNSYYPTPLIGMGGSGSIEPMLRSSDSSSYSYDSGPGVTGMMDEGVSVDSVTLEKQMMPEPTSYYPAPTYYNDNALNVDNRAIEMSSSRSVVVSDVNAYLQQNKGYIESINGRILSYNQGTQEGQGLFAKTTSYGYLDARVPADKFDEANQQLGQNVQKVVYQSVNAQDITGQVVSIEEQLTKLKNENEERLIALDEAKDDAAKRRIQLEIDRLERQIDAVEQNQNTVEQQVAYATITVSAANSEEYFSPTWRSNWTQIFYTVFGSFYGLAYYVGALVIWTALYSVLWLPIMLGLRWARRKMVKRV